MSCGLLLEPLTVNTTGAAVTATAMRSCEHPPATWLRAKHELLTAKQLEHLISGNAPTAYANEDGINAIGELAMTW